MNTRPKKASPASDFHSKVVYNIQATLPFKIQHFQPEFSFSVRDPSVSMRFAKGNSPEIVVSIDADGKVVFSLNNPQYSHFVGVPKPFRVRIPEEALSKKQEDFDKRHVATVAYEIVQRLTSFFEENPEVPQKQRQAPQRRANALWTWEKRFNLAVGEILEAKRSSKLILRSATDGPSSPDVEFTFFQIDQKNSPILRVSLDISNRAVFSVDKYSGDLTPPKPLQFMRGSSDDRKLLAKRILLQVGSFFEENPTITRPQMRRARNTMTRLDKLILKVASQDPYVRKALREELAKFERGEDVPLEDLPDELQENVEDPPPSVEALTEKMERMAQRKKKAVSDKVVKQIARLFGNGPMTTLPPPVNGWVGLYFKTKSRATLTKLEILSLFKLGIVTLAYTNGGWVVYGDLQ